MRQDQTFLIPDPASSSQGVRVFRYGSPGPLTVEQEARIKPLVDLIVTHTRGGLAHTEIPQPAEPEIED